MSDLPLRPPPDRRPLLWGFAAVLALLVAGAGYVVWEHFNPYAHLLPNARESMALLKTARERPLTAEEFTAALRLCEAGDAAVQLQALTVVELSVKRNPEWKPRAVEVATRVAQSRSQAAGPAKRVLERMEQAGR